MTTAEIIQIGTFLIVSAGSGVAIATFRRNKRIELQNVLYKFKLEAFSSLVSKIDETLNYTNSLIFDLENATKEKDLIAIKKLSDQHRLVDKTIDALCTDILKYSVSFPENILSECSDFINSHREDIGTESDTWENLNDNIKAMKDFYKNRVANAEKIFELVRDDLGLEQINRELFNRARK